MFVTRFGPFEAVRQPRAERSLSPASLEPGFSRFRARGLANRTSNTPNPHGGDAFANPEVTGPAGP